MKLTRLDDTINPLCLEECLVGAEFIFRDLLTVLKAIVALYGSADGQKLTPEDCEDSWLHTNKTVSIELSDPHIKDLLEFMEHSNDLYIKSLCRIIGKEYPLTINDGLFISETVARNEDKNAGPVLRWIYSQLHFYGPTPPTTIKPGENTYFRLAQKNREEWSRNPKCLSDAYIYTGIDEGPEDSTLESRDEMLILSGGYFDFMEILTNLIRYFLLPLQPILVAHNEQCISLPWINRKDTVFLPSGVAISIDVLGIVDKSSYPSYRYLFDLIHSYEANILFKFGLIDDELNRRGLRWPGLSIQNKREFM